MTLKGPFCGNPEYFAHDHFVHPSVRATLAASALNGIILLASVPLQLTVPRRSK
jgi:hypothetical protein